LAALPPDALIVTLVPNDYHSVVVYGAYWDLGYAISVTHPATATLADGGDRVFPHHFTWRTSWDGKFLRQGTKGCPPCWSFPAREVWVWNYFSGQLYQAPQNLVIE
jgi:hypothetical protein